MNSFVSASAKLQTTCCISGGGPAGLMLGLLLARAGVPVVVLEKHRDFLRDFRGDTLHPSTLEVMEELGLAAGLLSLPHQKLERINAQFGHQTVPFADFRHLPVRHPFIALMPQWDFLTFLAQEAARLPNFKLILQCEAVDLLREGDRVTGVRATTPEGPLQVGATLVVAADGRASRLRDRSGLRLVALGAPIDVFWFRVQRDPSLAADTAGQFASGQVLVRIDRGDYWQCGYVIAKGTAEAIRALGIDAFRDRLQPLFPATTDLRNDLQDWNDVKLLTVAVNRLERWYLPGFLAIGDAAHAMSPIGGIGINLAIQDAVAAANILAEPLLEDRLTLKDLGAVQRRRFWPTRITQRAQILIQNRVLGPVLATTSAVRAPWPITLFRRWPLLQRLPARLIGMGARPEHVNRRWRSSLDTR